MMVWITSHLTRTEHISLLDSIVGHTAKYGVNIVLGSRDVLVVVFLPTAMASRKMKLCHGIIVQNNVKELQTKDNVIVKSSLSECPRGRVCISDSINMRLPNLNATIFRFDSAPCSVLRKARGIEFKNHVVPHVTVVA